MSESPFNSTSGANVIPVGPAATTHVGTVTILPPNGAWFVYYTDCDDYPLALFSDELSARRWADEQGYGRVVFWPFGKTWEEVRK